MKYIITLFIIFYSTILQAQDFKYSFNSEVQVVNGDSIFVKTRIEVSNKKISIFKQDGTVLSLEVLLEKEKDNYVDIQSIGRVGFDPINKIVYVQNNTTTWKIIGN